MEPDKYSVALFYRAGKTHFLAPGSILVIPNYSSAAGRTVRHRGFMERPETTRRLSVQEQTWAKHTTRYLMEYYASWEKLIADEEVFYAADPSIGKHFLETCKRLSQLKEYTPAAPWYNIKPPTLADQIAALERRFDP